MGVVAARIFGLFHGGDSSPQPVRSAARIRDFGTRGRKLPRALPPRIKLGPLGSGRGCSRPNPGGCGEMVTTASSKFAGPKALAGSSPATRTTVFAGGLPPAVGAL